MSGITLNFSCRGTCRRSWAFRSSRRPMLLELCSQVNTAFYHRSLHRPYRSSLRLRHRGFKWRKPAKNKCAYMLKSIWKKIVKSHQVNTFWAGFHHLKPLCLSLHRPYRSSLRLMHSGFKWQKPAYNKFIWCDFTIFFQIDFIIFALFSFPVIAYAAFLIFSKLM